MVLSTKQQQILERKQKDGVMQVLPTQKVVDYISILMWLGHVF